MQAHAVPVDGPSANLSWLTLLVKIKKSVRLLLKAIFSEAIL